MKGVILAAGKGTRLYPITRHIPKPLLPLGNKPTIHYAFERLKEIGVEDICIVVGEMGSQMKKALGDGRQHGVRLSYATQTEPRGLAHAVSFAKDFVSGDSFALYLGDAIYSEDFRHYARKFRESGCANLDIVKPVEDPTRFGVANVFGDRITKLVEKPKVPESNLAMAGMYFFGPEIWSILPDLQPSARGEYEITDAIQLLIDRRHEVLAGIYEGAWFDTGTLDSFLETSSFLARGGNLLAASVDADTYGSVVVGRGATVRCGRITDSVIMPGAVIEVNGDIERCILAGQVSLSASVAGDIIYGADRRSHQMAKTP